MNEEINDATSSEQTQSSEELTLDDLYSEFEPVQQTQTVQSEPQPQTQSQTSFEQNVPDPVTDADAFTKYMGSHNQELAALRQSLNDTKQELENEKNELATKREEQEFNDLSDEIGKQAGLKGDDVAPHLLYKFIKDENFQKIWQNRGSNPKAFEKVKTVLAKEMKNKSSVQTDAQLEQNDKALSEAINNASSNNKTTTRDDEMSNMSNMEFDRAWQSIVSGG